MKTIKISLSLLLTSIILSLFVYAGDDAPPALLTEFWGDLTQNGVAVPDGLAVTAEVDGVNYAQSSFTYAGMYDVMLVGGDRELTYNDDRNCAIHWGAGEACVPCVDEADCIEGPQDGDLIKIKVDNSAIPADDGTMPYTLWEFGSNLQMSIITPIGDWAGDGCVDMTDFGYFANHYGESSASMGWSYMYDIFWDDIIDMADFGIFANHYGEGC